MVTTSRARFDVAAVCQQSGLAGGMKEDLFWSPPSSQEIKPGFRAQHTVSRVLSLRLWLVSMEVLWPEEKILLVPHFARISANNARNYTRPAKGREAHTFNEGAWCCYQNVIPDGSNKLPAQTAESCPPSTRVHATGPQNCPALRICSDACRMIQHSRSRLADLRGLGARDRPIAPPPGII